jgi:hypothetical protein
MRDLFLLAVQLIVILEIISAILEMKVIRLQQDAIGYADCL